MRRVDLPEIEDSLRCPSWLRDTMTGYLQTVIETARPYDVAAPVLQELLAQTSPASVLDLASGSGGPWPGLIHHFERISVTLTDIAPPVGAAERFGNHGSIAYAPTPISALDPPTGEFDVWTMFTGLHHFRPDEVKRIMREAQTRSVPFAAFEATNRSAVGVAVACLIPLLVLAMMPRVRPRRFLPLLLTYFPPILPILIGWDGFASTLRSYTVAELEAFAHDVGDGTYRWSVEELPVPHGPIPVLALVGRPHSVVA